MTATAERLEESYTLPVLAAVRRKTARVRKVVDRARELARRAVEAAARHAEQRALVRRFLAERLGLSIARLEQLLSVAAALVADSPHPEASSFMHGRQACRTLTHAPGAPQLLTSCQAA